MIKKQNIVIILLLGFGGLYCIDKAAEEIWLFFANRELNKIVNNISGVLTIGAGVGGLFAYKELKKMSTESTLGQNPTASAVCFTVITAGASQGLLHLWEKRQARLLEERARQA